MLFFVPKETRPLETRVALVPAAAAKLVKLGAQVAIESGAGLAAGHLDADYEAAGASIVSDRAAAIGSADFVLRVLPAGLDEIALQKPGSLATGLMDPFGSRERIEAYAAAGVTALCSELIPRSTIAQKMDVLSSQANLAGYVAVITAADQLDSILPMMMTPAGTISPAKVFIIGVGVAGLQAIATARRLGARVEAFDTRPVVEEQVKSLGAKFVKIDIGEVGQTEQGYAKELTPEQVETPARRHGESLRRLRHRHHHRQGFRPQGTHPAHPRNDLRHASRQHHRGPRRRGRGKCRGHGGGSGNRHGQRR